MAAVLAGGLALVSPAAADDGQTFEVIQVGPRAYRARGSFVIATFTAPPWEAIAVYLWTIEAAPNGLHVSYGLDVERGFAAPVFLTRPFFRSEAESLMRSMREDILRRAASAPR